jgi:hypothetical protein
MTQGGFNRWLYRGQRPNWIARILNRAWATLASSGATPSYLVTLEVTGRKSGRSISLPMVIAVVDGQRYLVSMLGDNVQWVQNVRASGGRAVLRSGAREEIQLEEVPVDQRAPILKAYLQAAPGARPHVPVHKDAALAEFQKVAGAFPVFRLAPRGRVGFASMTAATHSVTLICHPQTRTHIVRGITVNVRRSADGALAIAYDLDADLDRLRIPPVRPSRLVHGLWEHTCFEAFIAVDKTPAYHELNCAPSGAWAIYAFQGYRELAPQPDEMQPPELTVRRSAGQLELDAVLHLESFSAVHTIAPLRVALAAVIEDTNGRLSYWALRHPAGKPDFHHADAFALTVDAPGVDSIVDPG